MIRYLKGTASAVLILLCCAPAALAGPTVTVRVEGLHATLLAPTTVTLGDGSGTDPATGCPDDSAAAAIEKATNGNWDHAPGGFSNSIMGETHAYPAPEYWEESINYGYGFGVCSDRLVQGDALLMAVNYYDSTTGGTRSNPLELQGVPGTAAKGQPFAVKAIYYGPNASFDPRSKVARPAAGVRIVAGGETLATTDADGNATVAVGRAGTFALKAQDDYTRSLASSVCAHDGNDGTCGAPPPCFTAGNDGNCGTTDRRDPVATLAGGLKNGAVFTAANAPKQIDGSVAPDGSGLAAVKLSLVRHDGAGHCVYLSGKREEWRRIRCGRTAWFTIGKDANWSYLLPVALGEGRYRLDVRAVDGAGNTDAERMPGKNRVVFRVR